MRIIDPNISKSARCNIRLLFSWLALLVGFIWAVCPAVASTIEERPYRDLPSVKVQDLAATGDSDAEVEMGMRAKTFDAKISWYRKSALQGNLEGEYRLGIHLILDGKTPKDRHEGFSYLSHAAAAGWPPAAYDLGFCYANGEGVPKNNSKAIEWYKKAALKGVAQAEYALAYMYFMQGVQSISPGQASDWLISSVDAKYPPANQLLGDMYLNGYGAASHQSDEQAKIYLNRAMKYARERDDKITEKHAQEDLSALQKKAANSASLAHAPKPKPVAIPTRADGYKPFTIAAIGQGKGMSSDYLEKNVMCKSSDDDPKDFLRLARELAVIDVSPPGSGMNTITYLGTSEGKVAKITLALGDIKNSLQVVFLNGVPILRCQY